jgi:hypothetical protein
MTRYLFVGERPSPTALRKGWSWQDGRLAAKQLFDALIACGINPHLQHYGNWFEWDFLERCNKRNQVDRLGLIAVALGRKVDEEMTAFSFPHLKLVHPAARGKIRKKATYAAHVKQVLSHEETR